MKKMSFYEWVSFERTGSSASKKLSIDIREDATAPKKADTLKEWEDYLNSKGVPEKTIETLRISWAIYWNQERREPYFGY